MTDLGQAQLRDWRDFCEGRKEFDTGHFYTLFMEEEEESFFRAVFSYFPNQDALMERINNFAGFWQDKIRKLPKLSEEEAIELAQKDILEKRRVCLSEGASEILEAIDRAKPRFVDDKELVWQMRASGPHDDIFDILSDYLRRNRVGKEDKYYALFEAFYGLTNIYEIAWYLGAPLITVDVNLDYYFDLWSAGGNYALTETELLVTCQDI